MFGQFLIILSLLLASECTIHKLKVENDDRKRIDMTTFGFLPRGYLYVNVTAFSFTGGTDTKDIRDGTFGFTLDKTVSTGISPYLESRAEDCILIDDNIKNDKSVSIIFFRMSLSSNPPVLKIDKKGDDIKDLEISVLTQEALSKKYYVEERPKRSLEYLSDSYLFSRRRRSTYPVLLSRQRRAAAEDKENKNAEKDKKKQNDNETPEVSTTKAAVNSSTDKQGDSAGILDWKIVKDNITMKRDPISGKYSVHFAVMINTEVEQGLYNLFFHNCANYGKEADKRNINLTVHITERNENNYLSAGHMPLPSLYFILAVVNFALGIFWFIVLKKSEDGVYKLHYLMLALLFVKSVALLFHGLNYHFIREEGHHQEAFAILYYITYLMKGTLLFVTILLIGAGWAFVKHILSDREKKIFIIVIPLQILANVAQIIIEETEEGQSQYTTWKEIFILVDLLCCGAILFPVVWSIRHLQEASQTDGKAAINLQKLKIFRHFYIMIVCYIYFTRIIVYLLNITVPFQYEWIDELFKELASLIFFIVTGYKFRPASNNPYLQVPTESDDEDMEMDAVRMQSGALDGVTRVNQKEEDNDTGTKPKQRESSHEYD